MVSMNGIWAGGELTLRDERKKNTPPKRRHNHLGTLTKLILYEQNRESQEVHSFPNRCCG